jgi:hypothetical protein
MPLGDKYGIRTRAQATVLSTNLSTDRQAIWNHSNQTITPSLRSCNGSIRPAMAIAIFQLILGQNTEAFALLTYHFQYPKTCRIPDGSQII